MGPLLACYCMFRIINFLLKIASKCSFRGGCAWPTGPKVWSNCRPWCHWARRLQTLIAPLYAATAAPSSLQPCCPWKIRCYKKHCSTKSTSAKIQGSGTKSFETLLNNRNAVCHWETFSHALMLAPQVMTVGDKPPICSSTSSENIRSHCTRLAQALMTALT